MGVLRGSYEPEYTDFEGGFLGAFSVFVMVLAVKRDFCKYF